MDGFRVVKLSEVIRQMDVVITCTGTLPHTVTSITSALIITVFAAHKCMSNLNNPGEVSKIQLQISSEFYNAVWICPHKPTFTRVHIYM